VRGILIYNVGLLITSITNFLLIFIVYFKANERKLGSIFILINLSAAICFGGLFIFHTLPEPNISLLRLSHLAITFLPVLYLHFVLLLLGLRRRKRKILFFFYGLTFFLASFSFSKFYVPFMTFNPVLGYANQPGPLYFIFEVMFLVLGIYGCLLLAKGLRKAKGFKRSQIRYCLVGFTLGLGGGATTFFPLVGINIPPVGIYLIPVYGICITYAIVKYRLMEISLVIRKGLIYFLITSFITAFFMVILFLFSQFYHEIIGFKSLSFVMISAFLLTLIFQPLRERMELGIDKLFYRTRINYYSTLRKATRKLVSILEMSELLNLLVSTPVKSIGIEKAHLLLLNEEKNSYEVKVTHSLSGENKERKKIAISGKNGLIKILKDKKDLLLKEELSLSNLNSDIQIGKNQLTTLDASVALPLISHDQILGVLCLGEKISGEVYSKDDLELLSLFVSEAGIALKNAQLFSETKRLESQVRQAEKLASLGTLAARMAHEIKNPLVSIRTFAELLPSKFDDKGFREEFSSLALKEMERIDNLITRLLNFTRSKDYHLEVLSVEKLIEESLLLLYIQASKQNIEVKKDYLPDLPLIYGDKEELKQVFLNILINSVQSMPEGGKIFISTGKEKRKLQTFVKIFFSDTGGGIPEKNLNKIFDPFFTTRNKGSGLGLFISYKIIHEHHGDIQVRNLEKGAEFSISCFMVAAGFSLRKSRNLQVA